MSKIDDVLLGTRLATPYPSFCCPPKFKPLLIFGFCCERPPSSYKVKWWVADRNLVSSQFVLGLFGFVELIGTRLGRDFRGLGTRSLD